MDVEAHRLTLAESQSVEAPFELIDLIELSVYNVKLIP